jgi:hypothetical protein
LRLKRRRWQRRVKPLHYASALSAWFSALGLPSRHRTMLHLCFWCGLQNLDGVQILNL